MIRWSNGYNNNWSRDFWIPWLRKLWSNLASIITTLFSCIPLNKIVTIKIMLYLSSVIDTHHRSAEQVIHWSPKYTKHLFSSQLEGKMNNYEVVSGWRLLSTQLMMYSDRWCEIGSYAKDITMSDWSYKPTLSWFTATKGIWVENFCLVLWSFIGVCHRNMHLLRSMGDMNYHDCHEVAGTVLMLPQLWTQCYHELCTC